MSKKGMAPGKVAHYYALMAWNGMNAEQAGKMVAENDFASLDATTYASGSVNAAKTGIEENLLKGEVQIDPAQITGEVPYSQEYFYAVGDRIVSHFNSEEELCDSIVQILEGIHDKWVVDNAKKYNRDQDKNDKRLYQHLPTALIGLDEVAKDLMFLAPILESAGYKVGEMTESEWGAFVPSKQVAEAYARYVEKYKAKHNIKTEADLEKHLKNIASTYEPLSANNGGVAADRAKYIAERTNVLANQVMAKNSQAFTKDQAQPP